MTDHVSAILSESEFESVGDLILTLKLDPDKVLGLSGIGPKTMESIQETLDGLTFPEPVVEEVLEETEAEAAEPVEEVPEETPQAEAVTESPEAVEVAEATEAVEVAKPEQEDTGELEESDRVKDSVSLDELFALKEMFQTGGVEVDEEDQTGDKKKGKKRKKKHVEIEYDEELGEVVARKKHKRGDDDGIVEDW